MHSLFTENKNIKFKVNLVGNITLDRAKQYFYPVGISSFSRASLLKKMVFQKLKKCACFLITYFIDTSFKPRRRLLKGYVYYSATYSQSVFILCCDFPVFRLSIEFQL